KDPLSFGAGDTNLSRYVHNSPTNLTDPMGLEEQAGPHWVNGGAVTLTNLKVNDLTTWGENYAPDDPGVKNDKWYEYPLDFRNNLPAKWLSARGIGEFNLTGTAVLKDTVKCGSGSINVDIRVNFSLDLSLAYFTRGNLLGRVAASTYDWR